MNSLTSRFARFVAIVIVAVLALSALNFIGAGRAEAETPTDFVVNVGWFEDIYEWNPLTVTMEADYVAYRLVYSALFAYDEDLQGPVNDLATAYYIDVHPDETMTVYIDITENAYFRNAMNPTDASYPLTADDVVYTLNLIKTSPGSTSWDINLDACTSFTAMDDRTVAIEVSYPKSTIIDDLADIPILCEQRWSTLSKPFGAITPDKNFGSGPFYFDAMADGAWYRFLKAPNYHGEADYGEERDVDIDGVMYVIYTEATALALAMNDGAVDAVALGSDINMFVNELGHDTQVPVTKMAVQEAGICDIAINAIPLSFRTSTYGSGNLHLLDPCVRQAIMMTLDKEYINDNILMGLSTPAVSVVQPGYWQADIDEVATIYNPEAARALLEANGYDDIDADGILEATASSYVVANGLLPYGSDLSGIRCQAPDSDPTYWMIAQAWEGWAAQAGVGLVSTLESESIMINKAWYQADYDIWVWHWGWGPEPLTGALGVWLTSEICAGGDNCQMPMGDWWYDNYNYTEAPAEWGLTGAYSAFDQNMSLAMHTLDRGTRKVIVDELQQMVYDSLCENPPCYDLGLYAYTDVRYWGWGDWQAHPGLTVKSTMPWLWFDVEPSGNAAPSFDVPLATSYELQAGEACTFSVVVSDREGDQLVIDWSWGDGSANEDVLSLNTTTPTTVAQTHTYLDAGVFPLEVRLSDAEHVVTCSAVVISYDYLNTPPTIVALEALSTLPWLVGQEVAFCGIAMDSESGGDNGTGLTFAWDWGDGTYTSEWFQPIVNDVEVYCYVTHTWTNGGYYDVVLSVYDGDGGSALTQYPVYIEDSDQGRQLEYKWYGMFQPPLGDWFDRRGEVYGNYEPLDDSGVNMYNVYYPSGSSRTYSMMWLDVTGYNMTEINMDSDPQFLPYLGTERGGQAYIDWYMSYLDIENLTSRYPTVPTDWYDGWMVGLTGDVYLDPQAAKAVLGVDDAGLLDFDSWWGANSANVTQAYLDWLDYEANDRLDIFPMYEYPFTALYFDLDATKYYDSVVLHIDSVTWGMECLMARWLNEAFMPTEWYFDSMHMSAGIDPDETSIELTATVENAVFAYEVPWVGTPCWTWQGMLGDYIPSSLQHPDSDFDEYAGLDYQCLDPASYYYGGMVPYEYTPGSLDLAAGETMTFEWPAGDQMFLQHQDYGLAVETHGEMEALFSEPAEGDLPGQVGYDASSRTVTYAGPIDFEEWSMTQTAHDYLASEWDRLGVLPYGMPYMQFSQVSDYEATYYECLLFEQFDSWETLDGNWTITNNTNGEFENWFDVVDGNLVASDNGILVYSDYTSYANWTGTVPYDDRLVVSFDIYLPMAYNEKEGFAGQVFYVGLFDDQGRYGLLTRFVMDPDTYPNGFVYWDVDGTIRQICPFAAGWHSVDIRMDKGETTWTAVFDGIAYPGLTYSTPQTGPFDLSKVSFMNALREESDTILVNSLGIARITTTGEEENYPPGIWVEVDPTIGTSDYPFAFHAYCYDNITAVDDLLVRWDWEGDGIWDTGWSVEKTVYHSYPGPGVFCPTAQVIDEGGLTGTWTGDVIVDDMAPVADAGGDRTVSQYDWVEFDGTSSYDDLMIVQYRWEFSDGWNDSSSEAVTFHTFYAPGTYTVALTVWDAAGRSDTDLVTVTVESTWIVTVVSGVRSENTVSYSYTPETDGAWMAKAENYGLKSLFIEVYEVGEKTKLVAREMISFDDSDTYPGGTMVLSNPVLMKAGVTYLIKLTPKGDIGTSAVVHDLYIDLTLSLMSESVEVATRTVWEGWG